MVTNSDRRMVERRLEKYKKVEKPKDNRRKALLIFLLLFFIILWLI